MEDRYKDSGFCFRPSDEQLCTYYLQPKLEGRPLPCENIISRVFNVYDVTRWPWEIFEDSNPHWIIISDSSSPSEHNENDIVKKIKKSIYAFTELKKHGPGWMRSSGGGTWKGQNKKYVFNMQGEVVGFKRSLTFYRGNKKNKDDDDDNDSEGDWTMHEYFLPNLEKYVLCKITKRLTYTTTAEISHDVAVDQGDDSHINHTQRDLVPMISLAPDSSFEGIVQDTIVDMSGDELLGYDQSLLSLLQGDDEYFNVLIPEIIVQEDIGEQNKIYIENITKLLDQEKYEKELGGDDLGNNISGYLQMAATVELPGDDNRNQENQKELGGDVQYNISDYLGMDATAELPGDNNVGQIDKLVEVPEETTAAAPMSSTPSEDVRILDYDTSDIALVEELPARDNNQQLEDIAAGLCDNYNIDINQICKVFSNFEPEQVLDAVATVMKSYKEDAFLFGGQQTKRMMKCNEEEEKCEKNLNKKKQRLI